MYKDEQWNNSWTGRCTFHYHQAVDLTVFPSNTSQYQSQVPSLGLWLPEWATADRAKQGFDYAGFYENTSVNGTGSWKDLLVTYAFGTAPPKGANNLSTVNISLANFLIHNVARGSGTRFLETSFKSDVHVVDCMFENSTPGAPNQAKVDGGVYDDIAQNVAGVSTSFRPFVIKRLIQQTPRCTSDQSWSHQLPGFLSSSQPPSRCFAIISLTCR